MGLNTATAKAPIAKAVRTGDMRKLNPDRPAARTTTSSEDRDRPRNNPMAVKKAVGANEDSELGFQDAAMLLQAEQIDALIDGVMRMKAPKVENSPAIEDLPGCLFSRDEAARHFFSAGSAAFFAAAAQSPATTVRIFFASTCFWNAY